MPTKVKELEYNLHGLSRLVVNRVTPRKKPMKEKELEHLLNGLARLVVSRVIQSKKPTKEKELEYMLHGGRSLDTGQATSFSISLSGT